ncbi:hypothetical protein J2T47_003405 [Pseudomonas nitroreducens]|nr:hypothetical protein [Pseudomonas nitroreducens]
MPAIARMARSYRKSQRIRTGRSNPAIYPPRDIYTPKAPLLA